MDWQVLDRLRQSAPDVDLQKIFTNIDARKSIRHNAAIATDDLTSDFAAAGVLLLIESLEEDSDDVFGFSKSLTRNTVIAKTQECNSRASEGSFRSRWKFLPDYLADVVQYGLHLSAITNSISSVSYVAHESLSASVEELCVQVSIHVQRNFGIFRLRLLCEAISRKNDHFSSGFRDSLERERHELRSSLLAMLRCHARRPRSAEDEQILVEAIHALLLGVIVSGSSTASKQSIVALLKAALVPMLEHRTVAIDSSHVSADGTWSDGSAEESDDESRPAVIEFRLSEQLAGPS